jgi:hypothetical protein
MAVIKIVPMPGAEGQKGDTGAAGPQGPQGATGAQGPAGADAVWYYNGAYNPGASYAVGDVVTYEGQTWYRKHANGGNVGDTPSVGPFWDLIAAKGEDGGLTYWDGTGNPGTPTNPGIAILNGIATPLGGGLLLSASDKITINANNGEFINDATIPENQIATIGDLTTPTSGTWNPKFAENSDITYSDAANLHEFGNYYSIGDLVFFDVFIKLNNVQNWGNSSGFVFELPHMTSPHVNGIFTGLTFTGMIWDHSLPANIEDRTGRDQGLNHILGKQYHAGGKSYVALYVIAYDSSLGNTLEGELRSLTKSYPSQLDQDLYQEYSNIRISGTYRKA